jgi:uncharacterized protein YqjF (DUF2071 family)
MKQVWKDLLFAHWPANEADVLPYIPEGLKLQKRDGTPWISISPFLMDPLRVRGLPPFPPVHRFLEMNIRTYVEHDGKPGIFFFNLDASSRLAVAAARTIAHLPYRYSRMAYRKEGEVIRYESRRKLTEGQEAVFQGGYKPASPDTFHAGPGTLLHWLTERYCLYAVSSGKQLYTGDIHHLPWPLQEAELQLDINTSTSALGLIHDPTPALLTYTKRLEVFFWPLRKV